MTTIYSFRAPKRDCPEEECEDAFCYSSRSNIDRMQNLRCAIADGASTTNFASIWAESLVTDYTNQNYRGIKQFRLSIIKLAKSWENAVTSKPVPWYTTASIENGAASTFLGINLNKNNGRWHSIAVGDSCLFQISNNQLKCSFPVQRSTDFSNFPFCVSSRLERNRLIWKNRVSYKGRWKSGDIFILLTDAFAHWFLRECESGGHPWQILERIVNADDPQSAFLTWLSDTRASQRIKNDDTTCLYVVP